jgi:hypothetical protein
MEADAGMDAGPLECTIDGASVIDGTLDPLNSCLSCQPAIASNAWTAVGDGSSCSNGVCLNGACIAACLIDGGVVQEATTAEMGCSWCGPGRNHTWWTEVPDGTPCPMDLTRICFKGTCRSGCLISGGFFPADAVNPENRCQSCQPASSSSLWSNLPALTPCPGPGICDSKGTCLTSNSGGCTVGTVQVPNRASNPADPSLCCNAALDPSHWSPRLVFASTNAASDPNDLATGDLDRDGWLDLAAINVSSGASVYLNQKGTLSPAIDYSLASEGRAITAVDLDGDGFIDLVTEDSTAETVSVLRNKGDGTFYPAVDYPSGHGGAGSLQAGDFNGDGVPDLVLSSNDLLLFVGIGDGGLLPAQTLSSGLGHGQVALADFNGDGLLDIASSSFSTDRVTVFLAAGSGTFLDGVSYAGPAGSVIWKLVAGDLNGDQIPDLAVATGPESGNGTGAVGVLLGTGDGGFGLWTFSPSAGAAYGLAVADLDGDGTSELIFSASSIGEAGLYQVASGKTQQLVGADGGYFDQIVVGDFNRDGAPDVAAITYFSVSLYLNGCP